MLDMGRLRSSNGLHLQAAFPSHILLASAVVAEAAAVLLEGAADLLEGAADQTAPTMGPIMVQTQTQTQTVQTQTQTAQIITATMEKEAAGALKLTINTKLEIRFSAMPARFTTVLERR